MQTIEVSRRLNVSTAVIRQWAGVGGPYARFLSTSAQGGGAARNFTDRDVRILTLCKKLSDENKKREEIAERLAELEAAGWPSLPEIPPLPGPEGDEPRVSLNEVQAVIAKERAPLEAQITILRGEITGLEQALERAEGRADALQTELNEKRDLLNRAEGRLEIYDARLTDARGLGTTWQRIALAAVVIALVLLAVVVVLALQGAG